MADQDNTSGAARPARRKRAAKKTTARRESVAGEAMDPTEGVVHGKDMDPTEGVVHGSADPSGGLRAKGI